MYPALLAQRKDGIKYAECVPGRLTCDAAVLDVRPACVGVGEEAGVSKEGGVPAVLREAVACGDARQKGGGRSVKR